jgi:hypothetical protein
MNVDQWEDTYSPRDTGDDSGSWDGKLFETYGTDALLVADMNKYDSRKVWTLVENDGALSIVNGFHLVNRIGHFITDEPYKGDEPLEIPVTDGDVFV